MGEGQERVQTSMMTPEEKKKVADLLAQEHVAVLITQGEEWLTGTMQAFAETEELDIIFIMAETAEKFQNLLNRPRVTVIIDTRDKGDVPTFQVTRAPILGALSAVTRNTSE